MGLVRPAEMSDELAEALRPEDMTADAVLVDTNYCC